jgi:hypothetical protein
MKTYSAESGYAYQYCFEGFRAMEEGWEYVFRVSGDRKTWRDVSVVLRRDLVAGWEQAHRELSASERHGMAKIALFQALDGAGSPGAVGERVVPDGRELDGIGRVLDL